MCDYCDFCAGDVLNGIILYLFILYTFSLVSYDYFQVVFIHLLHPARVLGFEFIDDRADNVAEVLGCQVGLDDNSRGHGLY